MFNLVGQSATGKTVSLLNEPTRRDPSSSPSSAPSSSPEPATPIDSRLSSPVIQMKRSNSASRQEPSSSSLQPLEESEPQPEKAKKKHVCPTCSRPFTTSGHLARHMRVHTGERNRAFLLLFFLIYSNRISFRQMPIPGMRDSLQPPRQSPTTVSCHFFNP